MKAKKKIRPYVPGGKNKISQKQYNGLPVTSSNKKAIIAGYDYSKVKNFGMLPLEVHPAKSITGEVAADTITLGSKAVIPDGSELSFGIKPSKSIVFARVIRIGNNVTISRIDKGQGAAPKISCGNYVTIHVAEAKNITCGSHLNLSGPSRVDEVEAEDHATISGESIQIKSIKAKGHAEIRGHKKTPLVCQTAFLGEKSHIENALIETATVGKNSTIYNATINSLAGGGCSFSGKTKIKTFMMGGTAANLFKGKDLVLPESPTTYLKSTFQNIKKLKHAKLNSCQVEGETDDPPVLVQNSISNSEVNSCLIEDATIQNNSKVFNCSLINTAVKNSVVEDAHFSGNTVSITEESKILGTNSSDADVVLINGGEHNLSSIPIPIAEHSLVSVSNAKIKADEITENITGSIVLKKCVIDGEMPKTNKIELIDCQIVDAQAKEQHNRTQKQPAVGSRIHQASKEKPQEKPEEKQIIQEPPEQTSHAEMKSDSKIMKNMDAFESAYETNMEKINSIISPS